jgi:hypothetical protein
VIASLSRMHMHLPASPRIVSNDRQDLHHEGACHCHQPLKHRSKQLPLARSLCIFCRLLCNRLCRTHPLQLPRPCGGRWVPRGVSMMVRGYQRGDQSSMWVPRGDVVCKAYVETVKRMLNEHVTQQQRIGNTALFDRNNNVISNTCHHII